MNSAEILILPFFLVSPSAASLFIHKQSR